MGFRIGDIVMRMDGDKRPHKIVDITVHYHLNSREHTFFQYHYEDGGSDISDSRYIVPYDGKYKRNKVMKANEAPEKLYISDSELNDAEHCIIWFKSQQNYNDIEYTRTDAFIEKAEKAMIQWAGTYISKTTGGGVRERKVLATDLLNYFKKYMKEE